MFVHAKTAMLIGQALGIRQHCTGAGDVARLAPCAVARQTVEAAAAAKLGVGAARRIKVARHGAPLLLIWGGHAHALLGLRRLAMFGRFALRLRYALRGSLHRPT